MKKNTYKTFKKGDEVIDVVTNKKYQVTKSYHDDYGGYDCVDCKSSDGKEDDEKIIGFVPSRLKKFL